MKELTEVDVLILGAGAAGLMCAIEAGRRNRRVLVLEHSDSPGKKVLISGGGRCNFTNLNAAPENFLSANPHFAKSSLARFTPRDFIAMVERHRIPYHEKTLGQLFCDRSAHDILNMLLAECAGAAVRIQLATSILSVACLSSRTAPDSPSPTAPTLSSPTTPTLSSRSGAEGSASLPPRFRVETSAGPIVAVSLVIATGGLSIPKMGATSLGYDVAAQFGHPIVQTRPALVPLVLTPQDQANWCDLAGVSAEVIAKVSADALPGRANAKPLTARIAREKMLITHRGLSGPAILQVSSYWQPGEHIELDLAPQSARVFPPLLQPNARRDRAAAALALRAVLPTRMADRWLSLNLPADRPDASALPNAVLVELERQIHAWRIIPAGTEGYAKAEVTAGGVDTNALDAKTMQSRIVTGLYFIGEVVDVTGWLGGYNFQWAWASGVAAGRSA